MPLNFRPSPFVIPRIRAQQLSFHSTAIYRDAAQNHYETLQVAPNATPAEIKKYDRPFLNFDWPSYTDTKAC